MGELPVLQHTYDLIKWYIPLLNKLPKNHKFNLGDRLIARLYNILEELITARYQSRKQERLIAVNGSLEIVRYQTRLLLDFNLINAIGTELGGWIKQQKAKPMDRP